MPLTIAVQWSEGMELAKHQLECWPRDYRMNYKSVFLFRQHIVKFRGFVCLPFSTMHICTFICVKKHVHICTINLLMVLYMFRSSSFFGHWKKTVQIRKHWRATGVCHFNWYECALEKREEAENPARVILRKHRYQNRAFIFLGILITLAAGSL